MQLRIGIALFIFSLLPLSANGDYIQTDCYAIRYYTDLNLVLSSENDSPAIEKLLIAGRIKVLHETTEVIVLGGDSTGQVKEIREPGETETFYILFSSVGPDKPQGVLADICSKGVTTRKKINVLTGFVANLENTKGPASLAGTIKRALAEVSDAFQFLRSEGVDLSQEVDNAKSAFGKIKNADYYSEQDLADANVQIDAIKLHLLQLTQTANEAELGARERLQAGETPSFVMTDVSHIKVNETKAQKGLESPKDDALLNSTYQKVRARLSPNQRLKLRDEERAWLVERDKLKNDPGAFSSCTKQRIKALSEYAP
jgi:hypothetical protein